MVKVTASAVPESKNENATPISPNNEPKNMVPTITKDNCTIVANIKYLLFSNASSFEERILAIVPGITVNDNIWIAGTDSMNLGKMDSIKIGAKIKLATEIPIENKINIFLNCLLFFPDISSGTKYL